jgi:hypothetical protein
MSSIERSLTMLKKFLSSLWAYNLFCFSTRLLKLAHLLLAVFLVFILIEWQHENNLYRNIGRMAQLGASSKADTAVVQEAMTSINSIMQSRSALFQAQEQLSLKQDLFQSADVHLMYGSGACGGYSMVLARTLQVMGYNVRIGQLKVIEGGWGAHIIIEYYSPLLKKWVMIDPLFQFIPRTKGGNMASVQYLAKHWPDFEAQMPDEFTSRFRYDNVHYTNWDKFGGIAKIYYHTAKLFMGKAYADTICLRMYGLSTFPLLFWSIEGAYLSLFVFGFFRYRRKRRLAPL